jgi:predicted PurR-regulated permease PerM
MSEKWSLEFRYFFAAVLLILLALTVWYVREMFTPLIVAGLIAYILSPVVNFLAQRTRLSRRAAANIVFFISLAVFIAIPAALMPVLISQFDTLTEDLGEVLNQVQEFLGKPVSVAGFWFYFGQVIPDLRQTFTQSPVIEDALQVLESTSRGGAWFLVIVVSTYYFMVDWEHLREWLLRQAPPDYEPDFRRLYDEIKSVWMSYLRGQLLLMFIVGVVFTIIWSVVGLRYALVIGILTGLFSLVPEIGPLAATILAVLVALMQGSSYLPISNLAFAALVAGIYIVLINIKNIWLRPYIMGRSVNMNEGLVFVAIIAAVIFTGVLGALIIVPVLASLGVVGAYIRRRLLGLPPFDDSADAPGPVSPSTEASLVSESGAKQ